ALQSSGLADDAVGSARAASAQRAGLNGARDAYSATAARSGEVSVWRSAELWNHMRPGAIARDTWTDLRGGVDLVRAPGLYRPSASSHVQRPVDAVANPVREYLAELSTTRAQSLTAATYAAVGNEAAARALTAVEGGTARGWVRVSGGVQFVETVCGLKPVLPSDQVKDWCELRPVGRNP